MSSPEHEFVLFHPSGLRIQKTLSELKAKSITGVETRDMRNGYIWHRLPHADIAKKMIAMSLCFFQGSLESLSFAVVDPDLYGASWSDWSAQKEQARARATGLWLSTIGYAVGTYSWGTVWAGTDVKTGDGGGGVRFGWWP